MEAIASEVDPFKYSDVPVSVLPMILKNSNQLFGAFPKQRLLNLPERSNKILKVRNIAGEPDLSSGSSLVNDFVCYNLINQLGTAAVVKNRKRLVFHFNGQDHVAKSARVECIFTRLCLSLAALVSDDENVCMDDVIETLQEPKAYTDSAFSDSEFQKFSNNL